MKAKIKGYKAFEKGMVCLGFQYEEGKTFLHEGPTVLCDEGFHFCKNPLDVLNFYPLIDSSGELSEFAEVEALGETKTVGNKSVTNQLRIGAKLDLPGFIKAGYEALWVKCTEDVKQVASSEDDSKLALSGDYSQVAVLGDSSQLSASGDNSQLTASGDDSQLSASGDYSQLATTGNNAQLASSGDDSQLAAMGDNAQLAASGNDSRLTALGNNSMVVSSGDSNRLALNGKDSVGAAMGIDSQIKGKVGNWITLAEWKRSGGRYVPVCVKSAQIDGKILKEDTWYKLKNGAFIECRYQ
ncbi:hypothetical protein JOD82_002016 [Paenibacillus sp. 1182]|uniref:DUF7666 domain-containing protein n=1 Tax=Paenibacillus sp. 1182 TaxID=2806565 RepID=UPI001AE39B1A|nr:hypothetical protein [Paenibacillus sp. 1182]MBP1308996.1 hypothetical protein [Paenibacillus sp. 1182]